MPSRTSGSIDQNSRASVPEKPPIILIIDSNNPKDQAHDLYSLTLAKFDQLVNQGEILWAESTPEYAEYDGFKVEFRITPNSILAHKPIHPPDHPSRTRPTASNPFLNPDPRFIVAQVGNSHTLLLNKYCIIRPQSILHTVDFERQDEPLTAVDLQAAWQVLQAMEDAWRARGKGKTLCEVQRQTVIYNCGAEGGSSQGHRHMQLFPRPDWLFPDHSSGEPAQEGPGIGEVESDFPSVPYKHFVVRLKPEATAVDVTRAYERLLSYLPSVLQANGAQVRESAANATRKLPHNVCLVPEWIAVIPRRNARRDGVGANTAGMMGAIWLKDQDERNGWERLGVREHLAYMGVPK